MGKKILLVYPEFPDNTYWSFSKAMKLVGRKVIMPPIGLLTVAGMLPKDFEVKLVDMNIDPLTEKDLQWADYVFASAMIVQQDSLRDVIQQCNTLKKPIVVGGPYSSTCYQDLPGVDVFMIGEVENFFSQFLNDLAIGKLKKVYGRPVREKEYERMKEHFGETEGITLIQDRVNLNQTPVPRFDLLQLDAYGSMAVQFSRGCPVGCEFCDIWRRFGRVPRVKDAEKVIAEFETLYNLGWRGSVFLVDDNFIGNITRAKQVLGAIKEWQAQHKYPFNLFTEATLLMAQDEELLGLMREAGMGMVFVGIETPSIESLKETRKIINTVGDIVEKVKKIQSYGIEVSSGFIIGFDNDPDDIDDRMISFIEELGIPMAMVGLLTALPDTDLHDRLEKEGRMLKQTAGNNTHEFSLNFKSLKDEKKVVGAYKKVLNTIYDPSLKNYFKRCSILRDRWMKNPYISLPIGYKEIRAFVRTLGFLFTKRYGFNYYKFLIGTLIKKPSFLSTAIWSGMKGHHLREITRESMAVADMQHYFHEQLALFQEKWHQGLDHKVEHFIEVRNQMLAEAKKKMAKLSKECRFSIQSHYNEFLIQLEGMKLPS